MIDVHLGIKIDKEVKDRLIKMAKSDNRTLNNYLRIKLKELVDADKSNN